MDQGNSAPPSVQGRPPRQSHREGGARTGADSAAWLIQTAHLAGPNGAPARMERRRFATSDSGYREPWRVHVRDRRVVPDSPVRTVRRTQRRPDSGSKGQLRLLPRHGSRILKRGWSAGWPAFGGLHPRVQPVAASPPRNSSHGRACFRLRIVAKRAQKRWSRTPARVKSVITSFTPTLPGPTRLEWRFGFGHTCSRAEHPTWPNAPGSAVFAIEKRTCTGCVTMPPHLANQLRDPSGCQHRREFGCTLWPRRYSLCQAARDPPSDGGGVGSCWPCWPIDDATPQAGRMAGRAEPRPNETLINMTRRPRWCGSLFLMTRPFIMVQRFAGGRTTRSSAIRPPGWVRRPCGPARQ